MKFLVIARLCSLGLLDSLDLGMPLFVLQLETELFHLGRGEGGGGGGREGEEKKKDVNVRSSDEFNFSCESNIGVRELRSNCFYVRNFT